jgi:hypothetical protein
VDAGSFLADADHDSGSGIFRLREQKIVGSALETDRLGFLQQLGVVAPDEQLLPPPR